MTQPPPIPPAAPPAPPRHPGPLPPFKSLQYTGRAPGVRLIVTGAVHGNETCGTQAITRLAAELDAGTLQIARGQLTLVPVCNPLAYARRQRTGDRNLNRALQPSAIAREFEDHVANWLCPLLAANEVLLDLHSFAVGDQPFALVGPPDNTGPVEPFGQAAREEALARRLGVRRIVDGWLGTYARGMARRLAEANGRAGTIDLNPNYGVGTTEYMRSVGGCAITLECGQHDDPAAPEVGYQAIRNTLAHLRLVDAPDPAPAPAIEAMTLVEVVDKHDAADAFARPWQSFEPVAAGTLIGTRADGRPVHAAESGWIVFPNPRAAARAEWFYLAKAGTRF